ncbi:Zinc finger, C2H2 [Artemisia annua]|uniref:Zinc finger, C2H2 n=1 Tax=Artemisia annua TaxID=35608 RepID=A0A2U1PCF9_ARTAN|nr:Zinc finger, C2H2 [Artemisia annua]
MASGSKSRKDPVTSEVVAVSPNTLLNATRYVCDTCCKGFVREQNLRVHGRSHNLSFTLKKKSSNVSKRFLCPEPTCIYHNPSHSIGDYGGLKKHYLRKHSTEKNHKCDTCSKAYAAEVDLRAHSKICGKRNHKCSCGMKFQSYCNARGSNGTTNYSSRTDVGNNSINVTRNNNTESFIGSTSSYPLTFNMRHNSVQVTINQNNSTLTTQSESPSLQTPFTSYPTIYHYESQLHDFAAHQGSLMTNNFMGSNSGQSFPTYSIPSTQQNQHDFQNNFDNEFYTQPLMGNNVPVENVDFYSNFNGGSDSYLTPTMHHTSLNDEMNNAYGGGVGSFNQAYGQGYCG